MLLCHVYLFHTLMLCLFFHAVAQCLLLAYHCTFSTLLRYVFSFHIAAPSTFSTLLRHVYTFHTALSYLHFQRYCAMTTFSTMLGHVSFPMVLRVVYCGMSPFYALLCYVYFSLLLCHVYISTFLCFVSFFYTCMLS